MEAVKQNNLKEAQELLARGAGWNPKNKDQWSPMQYASCYGYEEMIRLLISKHMAEQYLLNDKKTNKNMEDMTNIDFKKPEIASVVGRYTPLHWATYKGHLRIVWLLLKEKMNISDIDIYGNTSIHQAVASGKIEMLECFLSFGADLELKNARGHKPIDLATDPNIKELILKALGTQRCKRCDNVVFDFENLRYYCQKCHEFYCSSCCEKGIYDYEFYDSKEKEKPYTRCIDCSQKIRSLQDELQTALGYVDFAAVDKIYQEAQNLESYITPKLWYDFIKIHTKLKHELDIHSFIKSLDVITDYKTILKSCKILSNKEEEAKKAGVELSSMVIKEINQTHLRLTHERNLRFFIDNLDSNNPNVEAVNELNTKIQSAENSKVSSDYTEKAKVIKSKMVENLEAKNIFQKLANYPQREYPPPEVKDPKKRPPKKEEDKKKKGQAKKKKKDPPFPTPEWAKELTAVIAEVSKMDSYIKKADQINLDTDFVKKVQVELARFKKEIGFRKRQEEDVRLEAEAKAAAKKKAKAKM